MILKHVHLFDFDQLLISTEQNSIEESRVSERLRETCSNYQRSFVSVNEDQPALTSKTTTAEEVDSFSTINNEKRTSAGKLVQQLICKYCISIGDFLPSILHLSDTSSISMEASRVMMNHVLVSNVRH